MANSKPLVDILAKQVSKNKEEWKERLLDQCFHSKNEGDSYRSLNMMKFNNAYLYYTAQLPAATTKNSSDVTGGDTFKVGHQEYVEPVLFNAVKAALPQLLDSFTTDDSLAVAFRNRGFRKNPVVEALVEYNINKIFLRDQDGYGILENAFKEILVTGDAFLKVFVDEVTHKEVASVEDWIELSAFMGELAEGWNIAAPKGFLNGSGSKGAFEWKEEKIKQQDPQTGQVAEQSIYLVRGKIPLQNIEKKLVVEQCEPNDLWFDINYATDFGKCRYICHRIRTTVGEALLRGFDEEAIKNAADVQTEDTQLPEMYFSATMYQNPNYAQNNRLDRGASTDPNERPICLYEHYIYSSFPNKKGESRKYQVITTHNELVADPVEIKHFPFVHGQGEPVQGNFFGRSFFDVCKPYQDALSLAQRMQQQVAMKTTWPQYKAVKGQYDRQSLLNNRPGAVIEVNAPEMLERFQPMSLDQSFVVATEAIKESMQQTVAQAVDFANSDGGVPQVATATAYLSLYQESLKGKSLTNNIKRTLVHPLMIKIYEIIKDEGFNLFAPDGSIISGAELPNVYDFIVDTNTTHDDFAQNMQINNVASFVLQAAQLNSPVITPQNIYSIARDMLEKFDIDSTQYLTDPSQNQDPHAAEEQARAQAIESERHSVALQAEILNNWKIGAEVQKLLSEAEKATLEAHNTVSKDQADSAAKMQKIMTESQNKANEIQVKAQEVAVKNKAVNYETILAAQKHQADITTPRINGVR
ncbi:hypothetical protein OH773_06740 [Buttiauxella sp. WJP83]|uniref:portal protein n=1 Tax=Buttiauxella sp. WJP83 TaxID=2986951 RepID=UPI0022DD3B13|nr:hypothetical protein [Buttiauxella sp. WJP83]WBM71932.1 hypothetical protein OH773_06740 [Buttiauxella sp. WJP83]